MKIPMAIVARLKERLMHLETEERKALAVKVGERQQELLAEGVSIFDAGRLAWFEEMGDQIARALMEDKEFVALMRAEIEAAG